MSMVPEVELSAHQIYELIKSGYGVGAISDAQFGIDELSKNLVERKDLINSLKNDILEIWQGDAVEAATNLLTQAADTLLKDVENTLLSNETMSAQSEAFVRILHTVAQAEPPVLTDEEIHGSADGGVGIFQQKLEEWEKQCQINVDAFDTYYHASVHNGQFIPSIYPLLNDGPPPEQNRGVHGDAGDDGGSFVSTAGSSLSGTAPQNFSPNMDTFATNQPPYQTQSQSGSFQPSIPHSFGQPGQPSPATHTAGVPGTTGNAYGTHLSASPYPVGSGYPGGNVGPLGSGSTAGVGGYYGHPLGGAPESPKNGRVAGAAPIVSPGENSASAARNTPATHRPSHPSVPFGGSPGGVRNDGELEHRRPSFLIEPDADEIFGCNVQTVPPVIGYVPKPPKQ